MARKIKTTTKITLGVIISTLFEDGSKTERGFKVGDVVENLRYVKDGEIEIVTGRIMDITYTPAARITWNRNNPSNTLAKDMVLGNLVIDSSSEYQSNIINVPLKEVVEWGGEENVARMIYAPHVVCDMDMYYSNYAVSHAEIQVGDVFDHVRILDVSNIGTDFTGKFEMLGFAYSVSKGVITITGLGLKSLETEQTLVADFDHVLTLNEVFSYEIKSPEAVAEVLASLADGDRVILAAPFSTEGAQININKKDVTLVINDEITCDSSPSSGVRVDGGSATVSGSGRIYTITPYSSAHKECPVVVANGGELTFNGAGIYAVTEENPADNGQFGVGIYGDSKLTINDGKFETGWYCVSGNGAKTGANSEVVINGGELTSIADYAVYHPHPGKLVINGGKISGAAGALAANNGIIEINGGEFSALGGGNTGNWSDGTGGLGDAAINLNAKYGNVTCRINGGTFKAAGDAIMIVTGSAHEVDLKISGGKFSSKPEAEWIAEGFVCSEEADENGFYTVSAAS